MTRQGIITILETEGLSPNKMFGQNFLCDNNITDKIINAANPAAVDSILEVGPGLGELTSKLSERCNHITAVEIDSGLFRFLSHKFAEDNRVTLIHDDFLKAHLSGSFNKVIANLPYYCASEILFKCTEDYSPSTICVMLQKEMAERICAKHSGSADPSPSHREHDTAARVGGTKNLLRPRLNGGARAGDLRGSVCKNQENE